MSLPEELLERIFTYADFYQNLPLHNLLGAGTSSSQFYRLSWDCFAQHLACISNNVVRTRQEFGQLQDMWGNFGAPGGFKLLKKEVPLTDNRRHSVVKYRLAPNGVLYDADGCVMLLVQSTVTDRYTLKCLNREFTMRENNVLQENLRKLLLQSRPTKHNLHKGVEVVQLAGSSRFLYFRAPDIPYYSAVLCDDLCVWEFGTAQVPPPRSPTDKHLQYICQKLRPHLYKPWVVGWDSCISDPASANVNVYEIGDPRRRENRFGVRPLAYETIRTFVGLSNGVGMWANIRDIFWLIHKDEDNLVLMLDATVTRDSVVQWRRRYEPRFYEIKLLRLVNRSDGEIAEECGRYRAGWLPRYPDSKKLVEIESKRMELPLTSHQNRHFVEIHVFPQYRCIVSVDVEIIRKQIRNKEDGNVITKHFPSVHAFKTTKIHDSAYVRYCRMNCDVITKCACTISWQIELWYHSGRSHYNETLVNGLLLEVVLCDKGYVLGFFDLTEPGSTPKHVLDLRERNPLNFRREEPQMKTCVRHTREKLYLLTLFNPARSASQFFLQQWHWESRNLIRTMEIAPTPPRRPMAHPRYSFLKMEVDFGGILVHLRTVIGNDELIIYLKFDYYNTQCSKN